MWMSRVSGTMRHLSPVTGLLRLASHVQGSPRSSSVVGFPSSFKAEPPSVASDAGFCSSLACRWTTSLLLHVVAVGVGRWYLGHPDPVLLDEYPGEYAGSHGRSIFDFWGPSVLFSTAAAPSPPAEREGPLFSAASPACAVSCLSDDSDADRCAVVSRGLDLLIRGAEHFSRPWWPCVCSLWRHASSSARFLTGY